MLPDLQHAGKIRAFGCSTFPAADIVESHAVAERRGLGRFRTEQSPYSILARGIEESVLPVAQRYRMGVLTWAPLAWSFLSGKYRGGRPVDLSSGRPSMRPEQFDPDAPGNAAKYAAVDQLAALADEVGCTLPQLAVAFVVTHPGVTSAILGPRTMAHLEDALKGATLTLEDAVLDRIDEIVPPGVNLYNPNAAFPVAALRDPALRRRPTEERSAA